MVKIRKSELPCCFDVDETLIMKSPVMDAEYTIPLNFHGTVKFAKALKQHVEFLKACNSRGYEVTVWSANGYQWAYEVVRALKLEEYVTYVCTKPLFYCDDKPADGWMKQVFIKESQ